ncbi:MAG TPA: hypothetical protein PLI97_12325, partial [Fluviicola sp.]|nr:hypothetical protein [Fluviicola sp.]
MKKIIAIALLVSGFTSCVPAKKYNDLVEKEKTCSEELAKYKSMAIENEGKSKDLQVMVDQYKKDVSVLK